MEEIFTTHSTFQIERRYAANPGKVFLHFSNAENKKLWFLNESEQGLISYELDFAVGGKEIARWEWNGAQDGPIPPGTIMGNDTVYLDIVPEKRIVLAYTMSMNEQRFSSSHLTFQFIAEEEATLLRATEQGAYFEGAEPPAMRKEGWEFLLTALGQSLELSGAQ